MQGIGSIFWGVQDLGIGLMESGRAAVVRAATVIGLQPLAALLALLLTLPLVGLGFSAHRLSTVPRSPRRCKALNL